MSLSPFIEGAIAGNYTNFKRIEFYGSFILPSVNQLVDYFKKDNVAYKKNPKHIVYKKTSKFLLVFLFYNQKILTHTEVLGFSLKVMPPLLSALKSNIFLH